MHVSIYLSIYQPINLQIYLFWSVPIHIYIYIYIYIYSNPILAESSMKTLPSKIRVVHLRKVLTTIKNSKLENSWLSWHTWILMIVTLCRWFAKQTIPLSVLARNQTKGFGPAISTWPAVGRERQSESKIKGLRRRQLAKGDASDQSTPEQRDQSDEMRSRPVREDESRWVGIPVAL